MPSSAPASEPASFSTVDAEVQAAPALAEDSRSTPEERAEMLMEVARGLQIKPRSAQQLHDGGVQALLDAQDCFEATRADLAAHGLPEAAAELDMNLGLVSQGLPGAHCGRIQDATARCACFKGAKRWLAATRDSLCWPYALAIAGDTAVVVGSGNSRLLLWDVVR